MYIQYNEIFVVKDTDNITKEIVIQHIFIFLLKNMSYLRPLAYPEILIEELEGTNGKNCDTIW